MIRTLLMTLLLLPAWGWAQNLATDVNNDPVRPLCANAAVGDCTKIMQQITNDVAQIESPGYETASGCTPPCAFGYPVLGHYQTTYNVWGHDNVPMIQLPSGAWFGISGDEWIGFNCDGSNSTTHAAYPACPSGAFNAIWSRALPAQNKADPNGGILGSNTGGDPLGFKPMEWIPSGSTIQGCNTIPQLVSDLAGGNTNPTPVTTSCWTPQYIINTSHIALTQPVFAIQHFSPSLGTDADGLQMDILTGNEPLAMWIADGGSGNTVYVLWNTTAWGTNPTGGDFKGASILAEMTTSIASLGPTMSGEVQFTNISTFSQDPYVVNRTGGATCTFTNGTPGTVTSSSAIFANYMSIASGGTADLVLVDVGRSKMYTIANVTSTTAVTLGQSYTAGTISGQPCYVLQQQKRNVGKFIGGGAYVVDPSTVPWQSQLPSAIRSVAKVLLVWGNTWAWRESNMYLLAMDASTLNATTYTLNGTRSAQIDGATGGLTNAYYLTGLSAGGVPTWTLGHEESAIPLLTSYQHACSASVANTGNEMCFGLNTMSVAWNSDAGRFVMMDANTTMDGMQVRVSPTPWGPWSIEYKTLPAANDNPPTTSMSYQLMYTGSNYTFNRATPHNASVNCPGLTCGITCASCAGSVGLNRGYAITDAVTEWGQPIQTGNWYAAEQYPGLSWKAKVNGVPYAAAIHNLSNHGNYNIWNAETDFAITVGKGASGVGGSSGGAGGTAGGGGSSN